MAPEPRPAPAFRRAAALASAMCAVQILIERYDVLLALALAGNQAIAVTLFDAINSLLQAVEGSCGSHLVYSFSFSPIILNNQQVFYLS